MTTFRLPDLGEGLQEAEIVTWHVGVGDHVVADQPLVSVETEKAVVEIPSPQAGRIAKLHPGVGDVVAVDAPLVDFGDAPIAETGTVVGEIPQQAPAKTTEPTPQVKAAPAVRAKARALNVDLASVGPTGPGSTITAADVEHAAAEVRGDAEPLRGVRRAMAANMARAHAEVVPATVTDVADIGAWATTGDPTMRLVRAVVAGCAAAPALNAWYHGPDQGRRLHEHVDLGIAMDTADGLFVPVLRDAGGRSPDDLRRGLDAIKRDVATRSIPLDELRGQTITLSNFGMFGGHHAALVILPPQVAILGAGQIHDAVVAVAGAPAVRRVLPLSLTFDHRVVMGGEAARFLAAVKADLANPE